MGMDQAKKTPLSVVQQRFWFLQQLDSSQDNAISVACETREPLDPEQLQQRLDDLLEHHDVLRRVVRTDGDGAVQEVWPDINPCGVHFTRLADGEQAVDLEDLLAREKTAIQAQDPPFRVDVLSTPAGSTLILTASRIFCDIYSLELAAAQLLGISTVTAQPEPDSPFYLGGDTLAGQASLEKWTRTLQDATYVCELPLDRTRPAVQNGHTAHYETQLSPAALENIEKLAQGYQIPAPVVVLAASRTSSWRSSSWCCAFHRRTSVFPPTSGTV